MEFKEIIYEKKDGVAKVTINRPERYNPGSPAFFLEFFGLLVKFSFFDS